MDRLPYEILENIASQISTRHQYHALSVCKKWYLPFCRSLYRHLSFNSRHQFKKFISNPTLLQHGVWIRSVQIGMPNFLFKWEDCVTGAIPLLPIQVGLTLKELCFLIHHLPLLQSISFDPRLWHFMKTDKIQFSNHMVSLPPLNHPRQFNFLNHVQLQKLHLRGADIFQSYRDNQLWKALKGLIYLQDLTIDGDGMWDTEHVMQFSMNDMNILHTYLPRLERLNMSDSVHFITGEYKGVIIAHSLTSLILFATVDCLKSWSDYFGSSYPNLHCLNIGLTSRHDKQTEPFRRWINKLTHLKHLTIHPRMAKESMDEHTLNDIHIESLSLGLWGHDLKTSTTAFDSIIQSKRLVDKITCLVIPIWSVQMNLSNCIRLTRLELSCLHRDGQEFAIDIILNSCPMLMYLELSWGQTSIGGEWKYHRSLKTLRMNHLMVSQDSLFHHLSVHCPRLEGLFLRRCRGIYQLNMSDTCFKYLVISELWMETQVNYLKLVQDQKRRIYQSYQDKITFQNCIQRIKQERDPMLVILCGLVEQLVFNGCRI